jgi:hypothetical protein
MAYCILDWNSCLSFDVLKEQPLFPPAAVREMCLTVKKLWATFALFTETF